MGAEEDLLQVRESRTETADEEHADEETAEARDEANHNVHRAETLSADESRRADHGDERVRHEQTHHEREQDHDPGDAGDTGDAREE